MTKDRLYLFDTTLRDGAQTSGIDFSVDEKIAVTDLLERLGVDYIEGGYPGANPTDTQFFSEKRTTKAIFTAFGMTKRAGRSIGNDPGVQMVLQSAADATCYVAKSWDYHVDVALKCTNEENLESIADTVKATVTAGKEALIDCEHFFDGYKANPEYALACAQTAFEAGARWVVLCDTNGGTLPYEVTEIVEAVKQVVPGCNLGIHAHDDTGHAVANTLAAVVAGVRQVQGTLNGIGERCGNANLITLIPNMLLKKPYNDMVELGIKVEDLTKLTVISRSFDEILNRSSNVHAPYVGANAFATKAGIHASAILKNPDTYEHIPPEMVGNQRRVLVSDQAGKSNLMNELGRLGVAAEKSDPRIDRLLTEVKELEAQGFAYEAADASFELLARRRLYSVPDYFDVLSYRTGVERRYNAVGERVTVSEAVVKVEVDGEHFMSVAEGNGPVNALDLALRKDLGKYQSTIADLALIDYKVRILNGGTSAITRVLIESQNRKTGKRWFTVGVSENIVDASFQALVDSVRYCILKAEQLETV
ncbi:citramalate synthase [Pseudovibrio sp. Tun.PSC04-5.I4]|uniref:citramalate synthase n=1 Tax=Pseudovibrio sp. Tun.PSC04-5.I4 TaxID=1798213 RepID=UPI0008872E4A|nr:citramalate synthase [Pseudovibrio sp. Tun.PSC04-5.I4]SDQ93904.1 2-isopropylmalate synthase [Pseudovibrio sp. Tun.PSC04-5.I4]